MKLGQVISLLTVALVAMLAPCVVNTQATNETFTNWLDVAWKSDSQ